MATLLEMTEGPKDTKVFHAHVARYAGIQGESIEPVPTLYRRDRRGRRYPYEIHRIFGLRDHNRRR